MSSSASNAIDPEAVPAQGLTVIHDEDNAEIDVCFVHGFTGHPYRTWLERHGDESQPDYDELQNEDDSSHNSQRASKARKLQFRQSSRSRASISRLIYWPSQLLPATIPTSRVMVYGYDTNIRHKWAHAPSYAGVYDFGWDLLINLEAYRRDAPLRPILFIVHSLGGIVAKEMLRRSEGCETSQTHLRQIYDSTTGIIFFGTPHAGADPRGAIHRITQNIADAIGFGANKQVIDTLFPSSERLRELRDEFSPMVKEKGWTIYCFQEQYGVRALGGRKIVEDSSSCLNDPTIEVTQSIAANHMDMCRFRGIDDPEYKKVAAAVHRIVERVITPTRPAQLKKATFWPPPLTERRQKYLEDSLGFEQIHERKRAIKPAHDDTCRWVLGDTQYLSWLYPTGKDRGNCFIWIKGKPGTGKSTLMKLVFNHANETISDSIVISFFFHARGGDLEKTTTGLYRSLLLQIISTQPHLRSVLDYVPLIVHTQTESVEWTDEILKELIGYAIRDSRRKRIICFIDALDECSEEQVRDMISFLYGITKTSLSQNFSVCFSSRHYPHISIPAGQQMVLESREDHRRDIATYIEAELRIGSDSRSEKIKAEILRKSSGIFMWVVMVISILNREYGKGRVHLLRRRLREIPGTLYELFSNLVTRDTEDLDDLILCLQWTLFSARPLMLEELYFAMMSKLSREDWDLIDMDDISSQDMERFIVNASKGLVEATGTARLPTQFIHETVRDFLVDERATSRLLPLWGDRFVGRSHEMLRDSCLATLELPFRADGITPRLSTILEAQISYPFLDYATEYILYHSNAAQVAGIPQHEFLQNFPLQKWLACDGIFRTDRYAPTAQLLDILTENKYAALIAINCESTEHIDRLEGVD